MFAAERVEVPVCGALCVEEGVAAFEAGLVGVCEGVLAGVFAFDRVGVPVCGALLVDEAEFTWEGVFEGVLVALSGDFVADNDPTRVLV